MGRVVSERGSAWPESHRRRELYHTHTPASNHDLSRSYTIPHRTRFMHVLSAPRTEGVF